MNFIYSEQVIAYSQADYEHRTTQSSKYKSNRIGFIEINIKIYPFAAIPAFCDRCQCLWSNGSAWGTKRTAGMERIKD